MNNLHQTRAAQDNDLEVFGLLVEEHQAAIRAFLVSRINDPFEAHDLAQNVFLIAFRKLAKIDATRPIRPWLLGIAANEIRNHRRKRGDIPVGSHAEIAQLLEAEIESGNADWDDGAVFEALDRCLTRLGDRARELLRLRYEEGMDLVEIRSALGGKHSTITMKLHRLREQLRACIERQLEKEASHG
ncbi:ECF RNA polymerase sigma factor SigW [Rubripirellula tenax]|uniref:ECF RNA polymerase sigma factor SigW n=1 Tax=Rubripirellula tenax TaxID=2528015 RepID=A0A5C6F8K4_9BACT|nr:sigma-70 family RNA polymerase sigma factor [Rubripirellula tenax]TWU56446.1 ECF RNA polymerase sigma factor SigW [Rubripirellula tenax]